MSADTGARADRSPVVDSHVHFWDPAVLPYPWLSGVPALQRARLPIDFAAATRDVPLEALVFVEANPEPRRSGDEVLWVERLADAEPRIIAIVAFVDLTDRGSSAAALERLASMPRVRGIRHNIQGNPAGFCLQPAFVEGVQEVGRRGLRFDLCATHDQLAEVVDLVRRCPDTGFVLDHCGKPPVRSGELDPWRGHIRQLAGCGNVWCKVSGLLTEADPQRWDDDDLLPYAEHVVECFGAERLMYGSDWPVLTLAARHGEWYPFTRRLTRGWSPDETRRFYRDNALRFYGV